MVRFARLAQRLVLRPLWHDRLRTVLSVVAVALGIAAVVAVQLANRSAINSFQQSVEQIAGRANLSVTSLVPFDEQMLVKTVAALEQRGIRAAVSPVIESSGMEPGSHETLTLLAVDLASDSAIRGLDTPAAESQRDALLMLADPQSLFVGARFAQRHRLTPGSPLSLIVGDRPVTFTVRGILDESGPGAFLGEVAVLDIASGQLLLDRLGRLDRMDLVIPSGRLDEARAALRAALPPGLTLERPSARGEQIEKMLRAFRLNLTALSLVSLIVGAFLIYNTIAISVVRRRPEVGALRAMGVTRAWVVLLFLVEAAMLGLAGAAGGILAGRALASRALALIAATVSSLWVPATPVPVEVNARLVAAALAIGIGAAVLSALGPALRAASVDPAEALRRGAHEQARALNKNRDGILGVGLLAGAAGLAGLPALDSRPVFGYLAGIFLVAGAALAMPFAMDACARLVSRALQSMRSVTGLLAARSLRGSLGRASVLTMALATALAMTSSVAIMVHSFRRTVQAWAEQTFRADLFVRSTGSRGRSSQALIPVRTAGVIRAIPGVRAAGVFRSVEIEMNGEPAFLAAADWPVLARYGNLMFLDGRRAADVLADARAAAIVSEPFALRHHVSAGQTITLPTPSGPGRFVVRGVYSDYSSDRGYAMIDRAEWLRLGGGPEATSLAIYLDESTGADKVRQAIYSRLPGESLLVTSNAELKAAALRVFDRTFAITWALEVIAICVAVLGIANALLALVLERRREIGVLRYLGASRPRLRRLVLFEAALLGSAACVAGLLLGFGLSLILIYVVNRQSFGWTIQFSLPLGFLASSTLAIFVVTCLSALWPAYQAARIDPVEAVLIE